MPPIHTVRGRVHHRSDGCPPRSAERAPGSAGAEPSGTVTFLDGAQQVGSAALNGQSPDQASVTLPSPAAADHPLTAVYAGAGGSTGSTSPVLTQHVDRAGTTVSLAASPSPSTYGRPVTFTATAAVVAPGAGTPAGTVAFLDGSTQLGTAPLAVDPGTQTDRASLSTGALGGGPHAITAVYQGGGSFAGSTSAAVSLVVQPAATAMAAAPAVLGLNPLLLTLLNLRATMTRADSGAPVAGQTVRMTAGGTFLCSATTNASGVATCNGVAGVLAILLNGGYTATFAGTANYGASSARGPAVS